MTETEREQAEQVLALAQDSLATITEEAVRAEHIAELLAQPGLCYGDLGDGRQYVALDGKHLGYARREAPGCSALLHWFAYPEDGSRSGPYVTARQAAAALMSAHTS